MSPNLFEHQLRDEIRSMEIPDLRAGIFAEIRGNPPIRPRRRVRTARLALIAAVLLLLTLTAAAAAGGLLQLRSGTMYYFRGDDGTLIRPDGLHLEEKIDVPLSDTALANIAPYLFEPSENATLYEAADLAAMEAFIDLPLELPRAVTDTASRYRLWAIGIRETQEAVTVYVQIPLDGGEWQGYMYAYLRSSPINIITGDAPMFDTYALPDGMPVQLAAAQRTSGGYTGQAFYRINGVLYHISLTGENKRTLLRDLREILDTVGTDG